MAHGGLCQPCAGCPRRQMASGGLEGREGGGRERGDARREALGGCGCSHPWGKPWGSAPPFSRGSSDTRSCPGPSQDGVLRSPARTRHHEGWGQGPQSYSDLGSSGRRFWRLAQLRGDGSGSAPSGLGILSRASHPRVPAQIFSILGFRSLPCQLPRGQAGVTGWRGRCCDSHCIGES